MKHLILTFTLLSLLSCNDYNGELGVRVGKLTALQTAKDQLFFYRIVVGLSTDAYFISKTTDICDGLNKSQDYYFKALDPIIYYKSGGDTLYVYTSILAERPKNSAYPVIQIEVESNELSKYDKMYKQGLIQKVNIDSISSPGCDVKF